PVPALSPRYPGPGGQGWAAPFPAPAEQLPADTIDLFRSEDGQYWSLPSEPVLRTLRREAVESDQPLARHAALAALGRVADPKALEPVLASLGAPTKVVQIAASCALREIAARRGAGRKEVAAA